MISSPKLPKILTIRIPKIRKILTTPATLAIKNPMTPVIPALSILTVPRNRKLPPPSPKHRASLQIGLTLLAALSLATALSPTHPVLTARVIPTIPIVVQVLRTANRTAPTTPSRICALPLSIPASLPRILASRLGPRLLLLRVHAAMPLHNLILSQQKRHPTP